MPDPSLARSILGGASVVLLSGVAAYFGAGLAQREPSPIAPRPAAGVDASVLESIDRRLQYLERRVDTLELRASAVPDTDPVPTKPAASPPTNDAEKAVAPSPAPPPEPTPQELQRQMEDISRPMVRQWVLARFKLYGDAGSDAPARRYAQAVGDSTQLITGFGLRGDDVLDKVRKVYAHEWETAAHEIGPLVHDGLERADIATVRERLHGVWAESDTRLRPLFEDEAWRTYETRIKAARKPFEELLDEQEKARR